MKLLNHYVKGLTVFKEPVTVDFRQLPEGLIAITGPNGHGKTSLLESMFGALYRYLPTRDGALSKWCSGRDAQLALTLEFDDHTYEARVLIDAQAGKDEAYLTEDGKPLVNGKVTAYGKEITRIFGSPDFILSSLFSTQKKNGSFSRIPVAERKALFIDLLGLGHYPDLEDKAKKELARESMELERLRGEQDSLQAQLTALAEIQKRIVETGGFQAASRRDLEQNNADLAELQARLKAIGQELMAFGDLGAQLQQAGIALDHAKTAIQDTQLKTLSRQAAITQELQREYTQAKNELAGFEREQAELRTKIQMRERTIKQQTRDLQAALSKLEDNLKDWTERLENNRKLLATREQILTAVDQKANLIRLQTTLDTELSASIDADKQHQRILFDLSDARSQLKMAERQFEAGTTVVAELDAIPCQGREGYATCPKIVSAITTRNQLPELRERLGDHTARIRDLEARAKQNGHRPAEVIQAELATLRNDIGALETTVRLQPALEQAEARIKELDALIINGAALKRDHETKIAATNTQDEVLHMLFGRERDVEQQIEAARRHAAELNQKWLSIERELSTLAYPDPLLQELLGQKTVAERQKIQAEQQRADIDRKMQERAAVLDKQFALEAQSREAESARTSLHAECAKWTAEIESLEVRRTELEKTAAIAQELEQRITDRQNEISDWTLLSKALGKDGILALEIDAAGPGISAIVNDLLSHCFSSRFAIDLQTQRLSADGKKMLEDFDIRVLDNRRGAWGSIGGLSGGEEVVVNEAIGFGIAIYNKSNRRFETAFRDETTGALDPVAAVAYVDMLKRARALGHFSRVIFVTHNSECAELADARIHCQDGKITV